MTVLWDWGAIAKGAAASIVICLPLALVAEAVAGSDDDDPSAWAYLLLFGVLVGFLVGGFVAARSALDYPYSNGAVAAVAGFAVIQGVAIVVRLIGDEPVRYVAVVFNALLAYGCGLTGALAASRGRTSQ